MSIRCDIYDRKQYDIWFAAAPYAAQSKPAKSLKQWAADEKADVVYNLALFNMTGSGSDRYGIIKGRTLQYLKAKGKECGYGGTAERLSLGSENVVSGWKLAIKDGKVNGSLGKSDRRSRNMCGLLTDGFRCRLSPQTQLGMCRLRPVTLSWRLRSTSAITMTSNCCSYRTQAAAPACIACQMATCSLLNERARTADRCAA